MMRDFDMDEIQKVILKVLSEDYSGVQITSVHVEDDISYDDDEILRVQVVFKGTAKDIKPSFLSHAIARIRPALADHQMSAFPMMSFVSEHDAKLAACR